MLCQLCAKKVLLANQYELVQDRVICKTCYQKPEISNIDAEALDKLCDAASEKRFEWERLEALKKSHQFQYQYPKSMFATVLKWFAILFGVISIFTVLPMVSARGDGFLMILLGNVTVPILIFGFGTCIQLLANVLYRLENPIKDSPEGI